MFSQHIIRLDKRIGQVLAACDSAQNGAQCALRPHSMTTSVSSRSPTTRHWLAGVPMRRPPLDHHRRRLPAIHSTCLSVVASSAR